DRSNCCSRSSTCRTRSAGRERCAARSSTGVPTRDRSRWPWNCPWPSKPSPRPTTPVPRRCGADSMQYEDILTRLRHRFGEDSFTTSEFRDNRRIHVEPGQLFPLLEFLKKDCGFDLLADISAADYLQYPDARDRYGAWYVLVNTTTGVRLIVKTFV